jgi:hypothetical protein
MTSDSFSGLTSGYVYSVTFWQAMSPLTSYAGSEDQQGVFYVGFDGSGGGGTFQVWAPHSNADYMNANSTTAVDWNQRTVYFMADSSSASVVFEGIDGSSLGNESGVFLTDVQVNFVTTPLPPALPAALLLVGGLAAVTLVRRKKTTTSIL